MKFIWCMIIVLLIGCGLERQYINETYKLEPLEKNIFVIKNGSAYTVSFNNELFDIWGEHIQVIKSERDEIQLYHNYTYDRPRRLSINDKIKLCARWSCTCDGDHGSIRIFSNKIKFNEIVERPSENNHGPSILPLILNPSRGYK